MRATLALPRLSEYPASAVGRDAVRTLIPLSTLGIALLLSPPASALTIGGNSALRLTNGNVETTGDYPLLGEQRLAGEAKPERMISLSNEIEWVQVVYEIALTTTYEGDRTGDLVNGGSDTGSSASLRGILDPGA